MNRVSIPVFVHQSVAIIGGFSAWGNGEYSPTDEELASLSVDERAWLAGPGLRQTLSLDAAVGWPSVARAIREQKAKDEQAEADRRAEAEERKERTRARIREWLAKPLSDLIREPSSWYPHNQWTLASSFMFDMVDLAADDARLVSERVAKADREVAFLNAKSLEQYNAAKAAVAERAEKWQTVCREYVAANIPDLRRAATGGANVAEPAIEHASTWIGQIIRDEVADCVVFASEDLCDIEEHNRPRQHAFDVLDIVNDKVAPAVGSLALVDSVAARIVRADSCLKRGCTAGLRTFVEIEVTWLNGESDDFFVYADGAPLHEHADED